MAILKLGAAINNELCFPRKTIASHVQKALIGKKIPESQKVEKLEPPF
jgi:hypothetical protein